MLETEKVAIPDGFVLEIYVRPSVNIVLNIDRYEGGYFEYGPGTWHSAQMMFTRRYKHYRRFLELPGTQSRRGAVLLGEAEAPVIRSYTKCVPDLDGLELFLISEILPFAFEWDIEQGFLPDFEIISAEISKALAEEAKTGNRDLHFEFLSFDELVARIVNDSSGPRG